MNEMVVMFGQGSLHVSKFLHSFMKKDNKTPLKNYEIWDQTLIEYAKRFGTKVCFESRSEIFMYKICYPQQLEKSIVQKYLDCFYFDHLWGDRRCNFKWKEYIIDLLEESKCNMKDIQTAMQLAKQVHVIELDCDDSTSESRVVIEDFHKECTKENFSEHCNCDDLMRELERTKTSESIQLY
jgi:hypothetical protein